MRNKAQSLIVGVLVGVVSGGALLFGMTFFVWTVIHTWSEPAAMMYAVLYYSAPIVAGVVTGRSAYRRYRGRVHPA